MVVFIVVQQSWLHHDCLCRCFNGSLGFLVMIFVVKLVNICSRSHGFFVIALVVMVVFAVVVMASPRLSFIVTVVIVVMIVTASS